MTATAQKLRCPIAPPRDEGYYWVFMDGAGWHVAEWTDGAWEITGGDLRFGDDFFDKIGPRLEPPSTTSL